MRYYAAINDEYLGKSIKDGSLAIFEEKKDAELVCRKMDYDLVEVSVVKHETYIRITEENARLREALEQSSEVLRRQLSQYYYKDEVSMLKQYESNKQLLNQLKEQNSDNS